MDRETDAFTPWWQEEMVLYPNRWDQFQYACAEALNTASVPNLFSTILDQLFILWPNSRTFAAVWEIAAEGNEPNLLCTTLVDMPRPGRSPSSYFGGAELANECEKVYEYPSLAPPQSQHEHRFGDITVGRSNQEIAYLLEHLKVPYDQSDKTYEIRQWHVYRLQVPCLVESARPSKNSDACNVIIDIFIATKQRKLVNSSHQQRITKIFTNLFNRFHVQSLNLSDLKLSSRLQTPRLGGRGQKPISLTARPRWRDFRYHYVFSRTQSAILRSWQHNLLNRAYSQSDPGDDGVFRIWQDFADQSSSNSTKYPRGMQPPDFVRSRVALDSVFPQILPTLIPLHTRQNKDSVSERRVRASERTSCSVPADDQKPWPDWFRILYFLLCPPPGKQPAYEATARWLARQDADYVDELNHNKLGDTNIDTLGIHRDTIYGLEAILRATPITTGPISRAATAGIIDYQVNAARDPDFRTSTKNGRATEGLERPLGLDPYSKTVITIEEWLLGDLYDQDYYHLLSLPLFLTEGGRPFAILLLLLSKRECDLPLSRVLHEIVDRVTRMRRVNQPMLAQAYIDDLVQSFYDRALESFAELDNLTDFFSSSQVACRLTIWLAWHSSLPDTIILLRNRITSTPPLYEFSCLRQLVKQQRQGDLFDDRMPEEIEEMLDRLSNLVESEPIRQALSEKPRELLEYGTLGQGVIAATRILGSDSELEAIILQDYGLKDEADKASRNQLQRVADTFKDAWRSADRVHKKEQADRLGAGRLFLHNVRHLILPALTNVIQSTDIDRLSNHAFLKEEIDNASNYIDEIVAQHSYPYLSHWARTLRKGKRDVLGRLQILQDKVVSEGLPESYVSECIGAVYNILGDDRSGVAWKHSRILAEACRGVVALWNAQDVSIADKDDPRNQLLFETSQTWRQSFDAQLPNRSIAFWDGKSVLEIPLAPFSSRKSLLLQVSVTEAEGDEGEMPLGLCCSHLILELIWNGVKEGVRSLIQHPKKEIWSIQCKISSDNQSTYCTYKQPDFHAERNNFLLISLANSPSSEENQSLRGLAGIRSLAHWLRWHLDSGGRGIPNDNESNETPMFYVRYRCTQ